MSAERLKASVFCERFLTKPVQSDGYAYVALGPRTRENLERIYAHLSSLGARMNENKSSVSGMCEACEAMVALPLTS
jgi:hypothetical protein